jgi:hypothetical protein
MLTKLAVPYTEAINCPACAEDSAFLYAVVEIEVICKPQTEHLFNWQLVSSIGKEADESSAIITWPVTHPRTRNTRTRNTRTRNTPPYP